MRLLAPSHAQEQRGVLLLNTGGLAHKHGPADGAGALDLLRVVLHQDRLVPLQASTTHQLRDQAVLGTEACLGLRPEEALQVSTQAVSIEDLAVIRQLAIVVANVAIYLLEVMEHVQVLQALAHGAHEALGADDHLGARGLEATKQVPNLLHSRAASKGGRGEAAHLLKLALAELHDPLHLAHLRCGEGLRHAETCSPTTAASPSSQGLEDMVRRQRLIEIKDHEPHAASGRRAAAR
eukprot:CAMPEP_0195120264 /NCGR_PEP_ID=MMETSP0448-20130528/121412_1 /TAXON_ID=66468 /ORGANISM="Heterocapsa triquestra, Strain CCMP 448" /LENGTH=236 /DNA_ID=CAMNT_0040157659 /DNA_START=46 /DNA_END=752 /DNA_ORIENTATION=-